MSEHLGQRERKKRRTRRALIEAALELFVRQGYERTTVAEIAAAAEIAPRTFFSYFPSKEDLLFVDTEERLAVALAEVGQRRPGDRPADVLLRTVERIAAEPAAELFGSVAPVRMRLIMEVPALQGRALLRMFAAQRRLAGALHEAFSDELDAVTAAAMVGALVGALVGAVTAAPPTGGAAGGTPVRDWGDRLHRAAGVAVRGIAAS